MPHLPVPPAGPPVGPPDPATVGWVREFLGDLCLAESVAADGAAAPYGASRRFRGGQQAADTALARLDLSGYARRRSTVLPGSARGASALSPYIRHGLLDLPRVWSAAGAAAPTDRSRFRDELLWQEYARHLYARAGRATAAPLRHQPATPAPGAARWPDPLPADMACVGLLHEELAADGWLVNQTRMWLASQWAVRAGADWAAGEHWLWQRLLDGSRAANRLGWQWTVGALTGKPYGFSQWQVQRRAPGLCGRCPRSAACPIVDWPAVTAPQPTPDGPDLGPGPTPAGPATVETGSGSGRPPAAVWLTAESLGDDDPALAAYPDLPAVFVFDAPLLARLRPSAARLGFLAECLADLATRREVRVHRGDVRSELAGVPLAATWTPVPGWATRAAQLDIVATAPWRWLQRPAGRPLRSFSAWRPRSA